MKTKAIARAVTPPVVWDVAKRVLGKDQRFRDFDITLPDRVVRRVLEKHSIAYLNGEDWWFLASYRYQHNSTDVLARALLSYMRDNVSRDAKIFESGCGCGWFLIGLAQLGFTNLHGSDILPNAIDAAKEFARIRGDRMDLWPDNGFAPQRVPDNLDVCIATQWLYSAWAGNYSDANAGLKERDHRGLLMDFLRAYANHVKRGGLMIFMLVDAISSLRPDDPGTFPVRHSLEDVQDCLRPLGFVIERRFFDRGDHQPRMAYIARKT